MNARRFIAAVATAALLVVSPRTAAAGGFDELPDQGAQALGRGAAFTAKADDATAIYWNVAGLARQRGTKLQLSANFDFNAMSFQRAGSYADDPKNPATPYGGQKYPLVTDKNASFTLPMLAASTDFGYFERLTVGVGVFGPAATGRTFPLGIDGGKPSPARYDAVSGNSTLIFPTLGAGYRVTDNLDIGLAGHLALANIDQMSIAYADTGGSTCKNAEYHPCDVEGRMQAKGVGAGASLGVMYRPAENLQLGGQVRSPMTVNANGTTSVKLGTGPNAKQAGTPAKATTSIELPWILRAGVRYVDFEGAAAAKRELWDVELDATYEAWGGTSSPTVKTEDMGLGTGPTTITETQNWKSSFSLRAGGAYNYAIDREDDGSARSVLTFRGGAYYDAPSTDEAYTRLATNTMAKVAGTAGLGFARGAFAVNVAYAAVMSMSRTVTNGGIHLENSAKAGADSASLPVINNGEYKAFSHVVSIGVEVNFEALFTSKKPAMGPDAAKAAPKPAPPVVAAKAEPVDPPGTWWKPAVDDSELKDHAPDAPAPEEPPAKPARKKKGKRTASR